MRVRVCAGSDGQWGRGKVHLQGIAGRDQVNLYMMPCSMSCVPYCMLEQGSTLGVLESRYDGGMFLLRFLPPGAAHVFLGGAGVLSDDGEGQRTEVTLATSLQPLSFRSPGTDDRGCWVTKFGSLERQSIEMAVSRRKSRSADRAREFLERARSGGKTGRPFSRPGLSSRGDCGVDNMYCLGR